jgi:hypothetical protein
MGASEKMRQILVNEGNLLGVGGIARPIRRYLVTVGAPLNFTAPKADRHSSGTERPHPRDVEGLRRSNRRPKAIGQSPEATAFMDSVSYRT